MKQLLSRALHDDSTRDDFCFSVQCENCGAIWRSKPAPFSKAGITPQDENKRIIFDVVYHQEHELAEKRAARDAAEYFSLCPICRRLVCNDCFFMCEDIDMCSSCAHKLKAHGEPVSGKNSQSQPPAKQKSQFCLNQF